MTLALPLAGSFRSLIAAPIHRSFIVRRGPAGSLSPSAVEAAPLQGGQEFGISPIPKAAHSLRKFRAENEFGFESNLFWGVRRASAVGYHDFPGGNSLPSDLKAGGI
jgi:hypothetical protein